MKSTMILMIMLALLFAGCATAPTEPSWVNGDSAEYKSSQYLIGRGQASTVSDASDRARADLAKTFQVAIAAKSEDVQRFKSGEGNGNYIDESSRSITTHTNQIISGIQIAEIWQNPVDKTQHALAILPRMKTAASLRQQIGQLDDAIKANIDQSRQNADLFSKIGFASKAVELQLEREGLQKDLQVVDITGRGVDTQYNSGQLAADMNALLQKIKIRPVAAEGAMAGLNTAVAGALSEAGFMVDNSDNADFTLRSGLHLTDLGEKEGFDWQRGALEIALIDSRGQVRGTKSWSVKGVAIDAGTAVQRALNDATEKLNKNIRSSIVEMAGAK